MYLSSIAIKYTLIDIVVFDYIPFPICIHTTGLHTSQNKVNSGNILCEVVGLKIWSCEHCTETSVSKGDYSDEPNDC